MPASRVLWLAAALLLQAGCGIFSGKDNSEPPTPLEEFPARLEISRVWSLDTGDDTRDSYLNLQPVVSGGKLFTASPGGEVQAFAVESGDRLWETDTDVPLTGGPGLGDGIVLVGNQDGEVFALKQDNGEILWRKTVSSEVLAAPRGEGNIVAVRTVDGKLFGLDSHNGARQWVYDRSVPILSLRGTGSPVFLQDIVLAGFDNGKVVAVDSGSGRLLQEFPVAQPRGRTELERMVDIDADLAVRDGVLYVTTYQGRTVAFDLRNGEALWNRETSSHTGFALDRRNLYLSDSDSYLWAFDRYSGSSLWKQEKLYARRLTAPAVMGDYVVVGDLEGYVHWLRKEDGQFAGRMQVDKGPIRVSPVVSGDMLLVLSSSGDLYALKARPDKAGSRK